MSDYVTFTLDGRGYATRLVSIREVVRLSELMTLPGLAAPVTGLLDLRGISLPVVDMRLGARGHGDVLVLHQAGEQAEFGFVCDAVTAVVSSDDLAVEASQTAEMPGQSLPAYVETVLRGPDGPVFLVDVRAMTAMRELAPAT